MDNRIDMIAKGRRHDQRGEKNPSGKLTDAQVRDIRAARGEPQTALAARYGVGQTAISSVITRKTWSHVS